MRVLSLFSGIGGFDLFFKVAPRRVESNSPFPHELHSDLFELCVPYGMFGCSGDGEVFRRIVMFIKVNVMHHLSPGQGFSALSGDDVNVFGHIAAGITIWMLRMEQVIVAIPKSRSLAPLLFGDGNKNSPSLPCRVV